MEVGLIVQRRELRAAVGIHRRVRRDLRPVDRDRPGN
jgi:hypothetical protein